MVSESAQQSKIAKKIVKIHFATHHYIVTIETVETVPFVFILCMMNILSEKCGQHTANSNKPIFSVVHSQPRTFSHLNFTHFANGYGLFY